MKRALLSLAAVSLLLPMAFSGTPTASFTGGGNDDDGVLHRQYMDKVDEAIVVPIANTGFGRVGFAQMDGSTVYVLTSMAVANHVKDTLDAMYTGGPLGEWDVSFVT